MLSSEDSCKDVIYFCHAISIKTHIHYFIRTVFNINIMDIRQPLKNSSEEETETT